MAKLVVEIHVPLTPRPGTPDGEHPFPWIDEIEERLGDLEVDGELEVHDDGEEVEGEYVFFVTGRPEPQLLLQASRIAEQDGVPDGVHAVVNTDDGDVGEGRRVDLPL